MQKEACYRWMVCLWAATIVAMAVGRAARAEDATAKTPATFLLGGDISALTKIEEHGGVFRQAGEPRDLVELLKENGCNCMRLRLFVNPNHENMVVNDLDYTVALAKRIKAAGLQLLLNFHYSDTWADPGKQFKPAAWESLPFDELEREVEDYTASAIAAFKAAGAMPDIVQVGNEVTPGMLWPDGKLEKENADGQWVRFTRLLKAGIRGVRRPLADGQEVRILIHIDRGGDWRTTKWFFDNLAARNVEFDMIGQSFYPWWHGSLADLKNNLERTAKAYGKPIVVVETAYPHRDAKSWAKEKNMAWPVSREGQAAFMADLIRVVRETPDGLGAGVLYWYPESIPVDGLHIWHRGATALFDQNGEPLPAVGVLNATGGTQVILAN